MEKNVEEIVKVFYDKLQEMPNLLGIIKQYSTIEKLTQDISPLFIGYGFRKYR